MQENASKVSKDYESRLFVIEDKYARIVENSI
jgi:hypothetical protein